MKRALPIMAIVLVLAAAIVLVGCGKKTGAAAIGGAQSSPVVFMTYMGHEADDAVWQRIHDYIEQQTSRIVAMSFCEPRSW